MLAPCLQALMPLLPFVDHRRRHQKLRSCSAASSAQVSTQRLRCCPCDEDADRKDLEISTNLNALALAPFLIDGGVLCGRGCAGWRRRVVWGEISRRIRRDSHMSLPSAAVSAIRCVIKTSEWSQVLYSVVTYQRVPACSTATCTAHLSSV